MSTTITVVEAKRGAEIYGLKTGQVLVADHESRCFYFVAAPNGKYQIKISKKTSKCCHWGSPSTSPVFKFAVEG